MKYALLHNFLIFLLTNNIHSEFLENSETMKEDGYHIGRLTPENGPNRMTENRAFRSKHKYKVGTGHQGFSRRMVRSNNDGPQCAVMYRNNEPVGILQPYEESYRFLPVKGEPTFVDINPIPIKRKSIIDVLYPSEMDDDEDSGKLRDTVGFSDETYPSVFAKFRIDSRLAKSWSPENYMKRSMFKREQTNQQQSQESTDSETILDDVAVEGELKTILDDMGLIDDYPNRDVKRAIEDENLELGTNKINLFKEEHTESRDKRDDSNTTAIPIGIPSNTTVKFSRAAASEIPDSSDDEIERADEVILDEKRQVNEVHDEIALSEFTTVDDGVVENEKNSPYEIRVERAIRDKIHKLKEEVKKEIDRLRGKTGGKKDTEHRGKKDGKKNEKKEEKKDEKGDEEEEETEDEKSDDSRRKKRQTFNTLVEEENKDIDPLTFNSEDEEIHVRRKRNIDFDDIDTSEHLSGKKFKSRSLKQLKSNSISNPLDFSNKDNEGNFGSEFIEDNAESYGDEYNESELNDDGEELYEVSEEAINDDTKTSNTYEKDICNCDKGSKECKCNFPSQEKLNAHADAAAADPSKECNKNGNWKCASSLLDDPEPAIDEDSSELESPKFESNERDSRVAIAGTEHHCDCSKNGDCKCGSQVNEPQPFIDRGHSTLDDLPKDADDNNNLDVEHEAIETDNGEQTSKFSRQAIKPLNGAMKDFQNGEYFVDFHPGRYRFSSGETLRRKRENFEDMVAVHGGGPVRAHLAAIRERSMLPSAAHRSIRRVHREENNSEPRQLIDMSDEDIFGALPQGFQGGLQRYKRVKRN